MVIQWYGQACFKIQSGDLVVAVDPFSKEIGLTAPRFRANLVLVTHAHYDHANAESIAGDPFVIKGPGEYEVQSVQVEGIQTFHDTVSGKERGLNTMYKIKMEGITILHMGDFGESVMRDETVEQVGDVDIIMMPVGGTYTIAASEAAKIVTQIEPRIVIPMHYHIPGLKVKLDEVGAFLKEMGASGAGAEDRLTLKKKDIPEDGHTKVIVLKVS